MKRFAAAVTLLGVFFAAGLLTFAFGVYALPLLATLLLAGSLWTARGAVRSC